MYMGYSASVLLVPSNTDEVKAFIWSPCSGLYV